MLAFGHVKIILIHQTKKWKSNQMRTCLYFYARKSFNTYFIALNISIIIVPFRVQPINVCLPFAHKLGPFNWLNPICQHNALQINVYKVFFLFHSRQFAILSHGMRKFHVFQTERKCFSFQKTKREREREINWSNVIRVPYVIFGCIQAQRPNTIHKYKYKKAQTSMRFERTTNKIQQNTK